MNQVPVITIDGPSGTGKGTLCHRLAEHLGWHILDSGVLYRALAFLSDKHQIDDALMLVELAHQLPITFEFQQIFIEGESVEKKIRTESCGALASTLAAKPSIRDALLKRQREFAKSPGLVTDGRDMGTVVFPEAELKFYLDASLEERANRRFLQLKNSEKNVSLAQVVGELAKRDQRDANRTQAPMKPAPDAIKIDTTHQSVESVFDLMLSHAAQKGFKGGR